MKKIIYELKMQLILALIVIAGGYMLCALLHLIETVFNTMPIPLLITIVCYVLYKFIMKGVEEQ